MRNIAAQGVSMYDVIIVGGGNAALCAALSARQYVEKVLVLERAPMHMRGGNTRHTRNIRCAHESADRFFSGPYSCDEFYDDLVEVSGAPANSDLAKYTIRESRKLPEWMSGHGVKWQQPLAGTLHLGRTNRWFLGGGKTFLNAYYRAAEKMGIEVHYETSVKDLVVEDRKFTTAIVSKHESGSLRARAIVIATGGFEANLDWLKQYWGDAANNFIVRGTPYNDGGMLANLLSKGGKPIGDPQGFHAIAVDARAPKFDGGIVTRLDAIPFGIVVNRDAKRFYDEGENFWPKRYAIWGGLIAKQPGQIAYCVLDSKTIEQFLPPVFKPYRAGTIEGLANALSLDPTTFRNTVEAYNRATEGNTNFRMDVLDGTSTRGLDIRKSNWAVSIDRPPYYGFPLRPGITFTYMGIAVNERAQVLDTNNRPFENVFAAGEIVSGNILTKGYLGGFGLTLGAVFGKLAGNEAAAYART